MSPTLETHSNHNLYDRQAELKAFDQTKDGVKGLMDTGITEIPRIFHAPHHLLHDRPTAAADDPNFVLPIIDLKGLSHDLEKRKQIVEQVRDASANWGFFHLVNHGIPDSLLQEMKAGVGRFHELDVEQKKQFFERDDPTKKIVYNSNFDLYTAAFTNWRDSIQFAMAPDPPRPEELPACCREILAEYTVEVLKLGDLVLELLSEALGLNSGHLKEMDCANGLYLLCHYYPPCPQPELTMGGTKHQDDSFITLLLQDDDIGGLQILHQNKWVDVPRLHGGLVVNIGDLLQFILPSFQLVSNDKFTSAEHRILANKVGPRISVASFFTTGYAENSRMYGPIKELLSEEEHPKYREVSLQEYSAHMETKGLNGTSGLLRFKL
ncbi:1-aminocyclopropane-1-carboxylate oxidase homolog 1 [Linum perenne]